MQYRTYLSERLAKCSLVNDSELLVRPLQCNLLLLLLRLRLSGDDGRGS